MRSFKKVSKVFTFIPSIYAYEDRVHQLNNTLKVNQNKKVILFTKNVNLKEVKAFQIKYPNIQFEFLGNSFWNKSVFLQIKIWKILNYEKDDFILIDWFGNFYLLGIILKFKIKGTYIYSPVISNWGWVYKQFTNKVPIFSLRYTWIRLKEIPGELISIWAARYVVVQSDELKKFYSQVYCLNPSRIVVNYNFTMLHEKKVNVINLNVEPIVGFIGNFEKHKGNKIIYNLVKYSNYKFLVAGGVKGNYNKKLLERLKTYQNLEYVGMLNRKEVLEFYEKIDVLLLPSYHEGSPRVICEFAKYNKPIVAFDNPGLDYCKSNPNVILLDYFEDYKSFLSEINRIKKVRPTHINVLSKSTNDCYALFD